METTLPGEIYNKHSCFACQYLTDPRQRSFQHYKLLKGHCPKTLPTTIQPPSTNSEYYTRRPLLVFYPRSVPSAESTAHILQQLLGYGIDFQTNDAIPSNSLTTGELCEILRFTGSTQTETLFPGNVYYIGRQRIWLNPNYTRTFTCFIRNKHSEHGTDIGKSVHRIIDISENCIVSL